VDAPERLRETFECVDPLFGQPVTKTRQENATGDWSQIYEKQAEDAK
jgi:hypothetical protein